MKNAHTVTQNYRDRWSELPDGQFELHAGDIVDLIRNPGIGSLTVQKEDGALVYVAGFAGHILQRIKK